MTGALIPVDIVPPAFEEIVEAFVARDYVSASRSADSLIHEPGPIQGLQLSLISLVRMGEVAKAFWYGQLVMDRLQPQDPWSTKLIALAIGKSDLASAMNPDLNSVAQCQATFYAGASKVSAGAKDEAMTLFDDCIAIDAPCLELYLARVEKDALLAA